MAKSLDALWSENEGAISSIVKRGPVVGASYRFEFFVKFPDLESLVAFERDNPGTYAFRRVRFDPAEHHIAICQTLALSVAEVSRFEFEIQGLAERFCGEVDGWEFLEEA